jgi:hypothetical protein
MTKPARFSQIDLERLFRAARKADVRLRATILPTGEIEAQMLTAAEEAANDRRNPLDRVLSR